MEVLGVWVLFSQILVISAASSGLVGVQWPSSTPFILTLDDDKCGLDVINRMPKCHAGSENSFNMTEPGVDEIFKTTMNNTGCKVDGGQSTLCKLSWFKSPLEGQSQILYCDRTNESNFIRTHCETSRRVATGNGCEKKIRQTLKDAQECRRSEERVAELHSITIKEEQEELELSLRTASCSVNHTPICPGKPEDGCKKRFTVTPKTGTGHNFEIECNWTSANGDEISCRKLGSSGQSQCGATENVEGGQGQVNDNTVQRSSTTSTHHESTEKNLGSSSHSLQASEPSPQNPQSPPPAAITQQDTQQSQETTKKGGNSGGHENTTQTTVTQRQEKTQDGTSGDQESSQDPQTITAPQPTDSHSVFEGHEETEEEPQAKEENTTPTKKQKCGSAVPTISVFLALGLL